MYQFSKSPNRRIKLRRKRVERNTILVATLASTGTFLIGVVLSNVLQDYLGQRLSMPEVELAVLCILLLILIVLSVNAFRRSSLLIRPQTTIEFFELAQPGVGESTLYSRSKEVGFFGSCRDRA